MILRLSTLLFVPPQLVPQLEARPPHRTTAPPRLCVPTPTDVLLKVNIAGLDEEVMVGWLMKRGWASVLPMQPMFWQPLSPAPPQGILLNFRRKPTSEQDGIDGGMRFTVASGEDSKSDGVLLVTRVSEGQTISKHFSERALVRKVVQDLDQLPAEAGSVTAVVHSDMFD